MIQIPKNIRISSGLWIVICLLYLYTALGTVKILEKLASRSIFDFHVYVIIYLIIVLISFFLAYMSKGKNVKRIVIFLISIFLVTTVCSLIGSLGDKPKALTSKVDSMAVSVPSENPFENIPINNVDPDETELWPTLVLSVLLLGLGIWSLVNAVYFLKTKKARGGLIFGYIYAKK